MENIWKYLETLAFTKPITQFGSFHGFNQLPAPSQSQHGGLKECRQKCLLPWEDQGNGGKPEANGKIHGYWREFQAIFQKTRKSSASAS